MGKKTTVTLKQAPVKFRGQVECIEFVDDNVSMQLVEDNDGVCDVYVVHKDGINVGTLECTDKDVGKGKLVSEKFKPLPDVEVTWINDYD